MVNFSFFMQESRENWNTTPKLSTPTDSWQTTWDNNDFDRGSGIALDSEDNIIIGGTTGPGSHNSNNQILLLKYNSSSGGNLWNKTLHSGFDTIDLTLDSSNSIFIVGDDSMVVKFDSVGNYQWNVTANLGTIAEAAAITVDTGGNFYIVGTSGNPVRGIFVVKFDQTGVKQWEYVYHDSNNFITGMDLALDSSNNIMAIGYANVDKIILLKLSNSGNFLWNRTLEDYGIAFAITLDSANNIYLSGSSQIRDLLLIKCDSSGIVQWTRTQHFTIYNWGFDIELDSMDNIYIAVDTQAGNDPDVVKYDSSGNYQGYGKSSEEINTPYPADIYDRMRCIAIDNSDSVYLGGSIIWDSYHDIKLVKNLVISIPSSPGIPSYNIFITVGLIAIISLVLVYRQKKLKK